MFLDDRTLLPIGMEVKGETASYIIERFLGLGLTAQVYRARQASTGNTVALKVLRDDASSVSIEHFWHEVQVILEIREAGITSVPELYEQHREGEIKFLAMEFMDRDTYQPLDERLEPLPEEEALEIARQGLVVLQTLHEKVSRTYTDMQLKNFYWAAGARTLKILDWNHVSTKRDSIQPDELRGFGIEIPDQPTPEQRSEAFEALARRDLARFGAYFYRMVTGKGALEQGETTFALAQRAGERWENISVMARQILRRALHPDSQRRYRTAAEFLTAVTALQTYWGTDPGKESEALDNLLDEIKEAGQQTPEALRLDEVEARLDVLERRGEELPPGWSGRLQKLTQGFSDARRRGLLFYQAKQYLEAVEWWKEEAKAQGLADLWRWVVLAQTGAWNPELFETAREALEQIIQALEKHDLVGAVRQWDLLTVEQLWVTQDDVPTRYVDLELTAARKMVAGRDAVVKGDALLSPRTWEEAADAYEEGLKHLRLIPYAVELCGAYGWNTESLEAQIKSLRLRSATYSEANAKTLDLQEKLTEDFQQGVNQTQTVLVQTPGAIDVLNLCKTQAESRKDTAPEQALQLIDVAVLHGLPPDSSWAELRKELQDLVQRRRTADVLLDQIEEALKEKDWSTLQRFAKDLPDDARCGPRYNTLVEQVALEYQTCLDSRDLPAAQHLDAVLISWGNLSKERTRVLDALRQEKWYAEVEQKTREIESAVLERDWPKARGLARALPTEIRDEVRFVETRKTLRADFEQQRKSSLPIALELLETLALLGVENSTEREELKTAEETKRRSLQELEEKDSELRKQIVENERKRFEAEKEREAAEARARKVIDFLSWTKQQAANWHGLKMERGADAYQEILQQVKKAQQSLSERFGDLTEEETFKQFETYAERWQTWLEKEIAAQDQSQERLSAAEKGLGDAISKGGELTAASLTEAQSILRDVRAQLEYVPPERHKDRHETLRDEAGKLRTLFEAMAQGNVISNVDSACAFAEKLQFQLDRKVAEKDLLHTLGMVNWTWEQVKKGFGDNLDYAMKIFPKLFSMDQQFSGWVKFYPFSRSGQGTKVVWVPSLDPEALDGKLQAALTTSQMTILDQIGTSTSELRAELAPLSSLHERTGELEKRTRGAARWVPWVLSGAALLLGVALLALFLGLNRQTRQIQQELAALPDLFKTELSALVTRPSPTPEAPAVTPKSPVTLTNTTPTAWPTHTPQIAVAEMTVDWTRDVTLTAMPALTLTLGKEWTFATSYAEGDTNSVMGQAPDQTLWRITTILTDSVGQSRELTGTAVLSNAHTALWRPTIFFLAPETYQLGIRLSHQDARQVIRGGVLTVTPFYSATVTTVRVYDPGAPGMRVIYHITNTGNITDALWLAATNAKPTVNILSITGVITLTSGITQSIGGAETPGALAFLSPVPGAPLGQSGAYNLRLPELAPWQALMVDLYIEARGCPSVDFDFGPHLGTGNPIKVKERFGNCPRR